MAKQLTTEQKNINQIFMECKTVFLIPEYQRPYSWERDECLTLWENLYEFAFPDENDIKNFDKDEESYFMGTILTFKNPSKEYEIIDGQQRIVTFMLMLRAFYQAFGSRRTKALHLSAEKLNNASGIPTRTRNPIRPVSSLNTKSLPTKNLTS